MRDIIPRKQQTLHAVWATSALRPRGRGGAFGYAGIRFRRNRQSDGREGEYGAAEGNREEAPGED